MESWDPGSFRAGFCFGIGLAFLAAVVRWMVGELRKPFRPQGVVHTTNQSPWDVLKGAITTSFKVGLVMLLIRILVDRNPQLVRLFKELLVTLVSF